MVFFVSFEQTLSLFEVGSRASGGVKKPVGLLMRVCSDRSEENQLHPLNIMTSLLRIVKNGLNLLFLDVAKRRKNHSFDCQWIYGMRFS